MFCGAGDISHWTRLHSARGAHPPKQKCDCSDQLVEGSGGASLTAKASRTSDKFQDGASANERCSGLNFRGNVAR